MQQRHKKISQFLIMTFILPLLLTGVIPSQSQAKTQVLVSEEDGKPVRWKNVEEFWDFGEDQKLEFVSFDQGLIADYLEP